MQSLHLQLGLAKAAPGQSLATLQVISPPSPSYREAQEEGKPEGGKRCQGRHTLHVRRGLDRGSLECHAARQWTLLCLTEGRASDLLPPWLPLSLPVSRQPHVAVPCGGRWSPCRHVHPQDPGRRNHLQFALRFLLLTENCLDVTLWFGYDKSSISHLPVHCHFAPS